VTELRRFSHSLIDTILDCPRKAYYRYVEGITSPKTAALAKGAACDEAWNYALQVKRDDGESVPVESLLEITSDAFAEVIENEGGANGIDWGDTNHSAERTSAMAMSKRWGTDLYPLIAADEIQVELHRTLPSGRDFVGFVDFIGNVDGTPGVVGDNKTGKRRMPTSDADKGLQPYAYAWLKDEPIDFVFARAIDTGSNQSSEFVWTRREAGDINWYGELVEDVERMFDAGNFPPNPKSNLCGRKWCPYFERCQPHRVTK
jgi:CRISPR/Cas system-associated exonuclease Cas4 (RecB family)